MDGAADSRSWRAGARWPSQATLVLVLVGVVALLVRCVVVLATHHSFVLVNDAADYSRLGRSLAGGHGFGVSPYVPDAGPTALRPPGYPLLVGVVYWIFGAHVPAARLVGAVLGSVTAVLVAALVRQLSRDPRRTLAAGLLAAVYPAMVIASTSMLSEALFVPLSLGAITSALTFRSGGRGGWLAFSGVLLGLATLTRPVGAVLVIPVLLIALTGQARRRRPWTPALVAVALMLAPCVAWEIRDIRALHHVVPLTTQTGYLLAGTYNATSAHYPSQPGVWIGAALDPAMARLIASHPHASELGLSDLLASAATRYARDHPGYVLTVVGHNFLRLFDLTGLSFAQRVTHDEYGYGAGFGAAEYFSALALLVLALLGLLAGGARGWPAGVWLVPLLLVAATLPVQSFSRFRAPIDPYLVAAASSLVAVAGRSADRRLAGITRPGAWRPGDRPTQRRRIRRKGRSTTA